MKLSFDKVLENFYKEYKDTELKGYNFVEVSNIVKTPFRMLKESIKEGHFFEFRWIGLGCFRVREWQVRKKLEVYDKVCKDNKERPLVVEKFLIKIRNKLQEYIDKKDKENEI